MTKPIKRKICVVTGTRAEYGLLKPVMQAIQLSSALELQVVVTGMHLSAKFGSTWTIIEDDGFQIDAKVDILLASDNPEAITKSVGLGTISFADTFAFLKPDIVMVLGDRFELLAVAQAAFFARIPIAHISGGDRTEGAMDEAIRHAISKMSHLHFVTNADAAARVRQLGENPKHIFLSGNPGLIELANTKLLTRQQIEDRLNFTLGKPTFLITFHPVTLDEQPASEPFEELLCALDHYPEATKIFTYPNADTFGQSIIDRLDQYVDSTPSALASRSLGQLLYWSLLQESDVVIGNSSSGLLEAPSLKTPSVNIGDRQRGRLRAISNVDCEANSSAIQNAISTALSIDCSNIVNPYAHDDSIKIIVRHIESIENPQNLLKKTFFDLKTAL